MGSAWVRHRFGHLGHGSASVRPNQQNGGSVVHYRIENVSTFRLTLFIASSSFIILTLISIISFVSCFILCNEGKDMNVAQRSLIHSMSSSSALNLMAATATHNQLNQINSLDHNYYERELNDSLDDHLQVKEKKSFLSKW